MSSHSPFSHSVLILTSLSILANSCGGFCGDCPAGQGCREGACVAGASSGSCTSPYALNGTGLIDFAGQDRVMLEITGDTSTGVSKIEEKIVGFLLYWT